MSRHGRRNQMSLDELERKLQAAGARPVPEPPALFAERLENRLRAGVMTEAAMETEAAPDVVGGLAGRRRSAPGRNSAARNTSAILRPVLAGLAAVALLGAGVAALRSDGGAEEVRVASATDSLVVLPDGTVDAVAPGQVVEEGARVVTGEGGQLVAGEVQLGPNREATVKKGTLRPTPTTAPPPAPGVAPPVDTPPAGPTVTPPPTRPPADPKPGTDPALTTDSTRPKDPTATTATTGRPAGSDSTVKADPGVTAMKINAQFKETAVRVNWTAYDGPGPFAAYLVLRADDPHQPVYPLDPSTTVVARITDRSVTTWTERVTDPATRFYRVVAVDSDRRLLGRTPAVRPTAFTAVKPSTATTTSIGPSSVTEPAIG